MAQFRYVAFTSDGHRESGILEVTAEAQAWEKLAAQGLTPVEIVDASASSRVVSRGMPFTRRVPLAAQADLAEQLAVLFGARLPTVQIVDIVAKGAGSKAIRLKFSRISRLMADGAPLHEAIAQAARGLSPLFAALAQTADRSADPAPQMKSLATILRRQEKISAQVAGAMIYPIILMIGGLGVFGMMALYLAPRLATIFTSVNRPVPFELSLFILLGDFILQWWFLPPGLLLLAAVVAPVIFTEYRHLLRRMTFHLPLWGPLARDNALSTASRALQLMLEAKIPLARALADTAGSMSENPFASLFRRASQELESGGVATDVFHADPFLPPLFRDLFSVGEKSNTLPVVMAAVATALEERVERQTNRAVTLITPILTLIIGGVIALLVYAVMSALLSVNDLAF